MGWKNLKIGRGRRRKSGRASREGDSTVDDTNMYYCRVCGFPVDSKTTASRKIQSNKEPNEWESGNTYPTDLDGDYYIDIDKYCPFCGSPDWK
jgi:hypothetical protein